MIQSHIFTAENAGPKLLILGAVHGNEVCGTAAIKRVLAEFESGALKLARGQVTFVPTCNPRAYALGARFIERNLNRFLVPTANPATYEARLGNILCPMVEACDALLDLHSYPRGRDPFAFVGPFNPQERAFAASLGVATLMTGWEEAYANTGRKTATASADEGVGTEEYARRCGKIASILECGDHADPKAVDVAYRAIHNALRHFGLIEGTTNATTPRLVTVTHVFYRDDNGKFPRDWRHLDPVTAGEIIAMREDTTPLKAPANGFVVLPHEDCDMGQEWFYFGA